MHRRQSNLKKKQRIELLAEHEMPQKLPEKVNIYEFISKQRNPCC